MKVSLNTSGQYGGIARRLELEGDVVVGVDAEADISINDPMALPITNPGKHITHYATRWFDGKSFHYQQFVGFPLRHCLSGDLGPLIPVGSVGKYIEPAYFREEFEALAPHLRALEYRGFA